MRVYHVLLALRCVMVFLSVWIVICGATSSTSSREILVVAITLAALLLVFCIFLVVDCLKKYYLQYPARIALTMARKTQVTKLYCKVKPKPGLSLRIVSVLVESPLLDWTNAFHDYMSFYNLKYVTLVGILVAGITAWLVTISATVGTLSTITVGNAWHLMTCFMMDSMTQMHVGAAGRLVITQRSTSCVSVVA